MVDNLSQCIGGGLWFCLCPNARLPLCGVCGAPGVAARSAVCAAREAHAAPSSHHVATTASRCLADVSTARLAPQTPTHCAGDHLECATRCPVASKDRYSREGANAQLGSDSSEACYAFTTHAVRGT